MGSRLDEADADCHWLADPSFKSHPSPPEEYLGMHNYSSTSSDRISKLATKTTSSEWPDCFKFAPMHDELVQRLAEDGDSSMDRFEAGQFVCVDVALDNFKVPNSELKTVPKRQIHLKRCGAREPLTNAGSDFAAEASFKIRQLKDACLRQHSLPATIWEAPCKAEPLAVAERKVKLQKSLSLDETSSKTIMASSLIKSVLFKKMQHESALQHFQAQEGSIYPSKVKNNPTQSSNSKLTNLSPGSGLPLNSSMYLDLDKPRRDPQIDSVRMHDDTDCSAGQLKLGTKPVLDSREEKTESGIPEARPCRDIAKAMASTEAPGTPIEMTNKAAECPAGPGNQKQRASGNSFVTKMPKITYKLSARGNKSQKECLLSGQDIETQQNQVALCTAGAQAGGRRADNQENGSVGQLAKKESNEKKQTKPLTHKVRDLRKLVKSTYNLPFSGRTERDHTSQKWEDKLTPSPQPADVPHGIRKIPANKKGVFTLPGEDGLDRGGSSASLFSKEKGYQEDRMSRAPTTTSTPPQIGLPPPTAPAPQSQQRPATVAPWNYHTVPPQPFQPEVPDLLQPRQHSLPSCKAGRPAAEEPIKPQPGASRSDRGAASATSPSSLPQHQSGPPSGDGPGTGSAAFEQTPGHMLLHPKTANYVYVNVPAPPLCKMLFDPETAQYVQVQIPQQGAAYTGLYSTYTAAYPFFSYQSMYTPYVLPYITSYLSAPILTPHQP